MRVSGYRGSTISNSFFNAGARLELAQSKDSGKGRIDPTDSNCQYWHGAVCGMVVTSNRFSCSGTTCASINISHAIPAAASIYVHGNTFESSNASVCSNKHSCFGDSCKTLFGRCDISKSDGELTSKSRSHLKSDDAHGATTCDITTFGAAGDNKTDNTASIQRAIEACTRKGAATVIPAGGVYMRQLYGTTFKEKRNGKCLSIGRSAAGGRAFRSSPSSEGCTGVQPACRVVTKPG